MFNYESMEPRARGQDRGRRRQNDAWLAAMTHESGWSYRGGLMSQIPRDNSLDSTPALLSDGYRFISKRCRRHQSDVFETRLMLRKTVCVTGEQENNYRNHHVALYCHRTFDGIRRREGG